MEKAAEDIFPNHGAQGCVAQQPSVFHPIPQVPDSLTLTLKDRGQEYGDYTNMSQVAQGIKNLLRDFGMNYALTNYAQREALDLIATKLARIVCGNPNNPDSWLDIQGYAKKAQECSPPPDSHGVSPRERDAGDWPPATS